MLSSFILGCVLGAGVASGSDALPLEAAAVVEAAVTLGLPSSAIELKAREGLAKGVPTARLVPVLDRLVEDLARAKDIHRDADQALLIATAAALRAGATRSAILEVANSSPDAKVRATETLADLLRLRFTESDAVRLTRRAARSANPDSSLVAVSASAGALVASGVLPSAAASQLGTAFDADILGGDGIGERAKAFGQDHRPGQPPGGVGGGKPDGKGRN